MIILIYIKLYASPKDNLKKLLKISLTLVITVILVTGIIMPEIIMGTPASPAAGNWYQQFLPNLSGRQVKDITFLDSLNGFIITNRLSLNDTSFVLKTTNGGDNWTINRADESYLFSKIQFINQNTGFIGGFIEIASSYYILKTTNKGLNWSTINSPFQILAEDMYVLNQDTIWIVDSESLTGGVFRTTNGGLNWTQQLNAGSQNPEKIYMFNTRVGFISGAGTLKKTTNSGVNWTLISGTDGFYNIYFADSLTGFKNTVFGMRKTSNGGLNWVTQTLPTGGIIQTSSILDFCALNRDTLWGIGGFVQYPNSQQRGILYRTTNGGANWLFQIPDTNLNMTGFGFVRFIDNKHGWLYRSTIRGIHTTNGGGDTFLTPISQLSTSTPDDYYLYQNYPNPFNPVTVIKVDISRSSQVKFIISDILGKEIYRENKYLKAGSYEFKWDAAEYPSGIYFYRLIADKFSETKKMILIK